MSSHWHMSFPVFLGCVWLFVDIENLSDWLQDDGTYYCNVRSVDAASFSLHDSVAEVKKDPTVPLLLQNAMINWDAFTTWRTRSEFLHRYGQVKVGVGVGFRISTRPNRDGLVYSWINDGANIREKGAALQLRTHFEKQARAGVAPSLSINDLAAYIRNRSLPYDTYSFTPVDDTVLNNVSELHQLWSMINGVRGNDNMGVLFGLGGKDSGVMFHTHKSAVSAVFAGHKRWLIYDEQLHGPDRAFLKKQLQRAKRRNPSFLLNSMKAWIVNVLPMPEVQEWWHHAGWDCVQGPGDLLFVPEGLHHGTINLDETLSLSAQAITLQRG